jgi:hypothetical protein
MRVFKGRRPSPSMIVASTALIIALAGTAMAAPTAIKSVLDKKEKKQVKNIANKRITKRAPGLSVANATNAAKLGGAAPGECQTGWLKSSVVVDTSGLTDATPDATVPGAFDCASKAADAVTIHRNGTGRYTLTLAGLNSGVAISSSANVGGAAANVVTAASKVDAQGKVNLNVWNNGDALLVDGKTVSLIVF